MTTINFFEASECLKTIAHPKRLELIHYLLKNKRASVGELAETCSLQNHVTSEHLTLLKNRGFIESQKEGRKVIYSIKEPALESIMNCIKNKFSS